MLRPFSTFKSLLTMSKGKRMQEEIDLYKAAFYTSYLKANEQEMITTNKIYHDKKKNNIPYNLKTHHQFEDSFSVQESAQLNTMSNTELKALVEKNIYVQLYKMFKIIDQSGGFSPYPPSIVEHPSRKSSNLHDMDPAVKAEIDKQWREFTYKPGTPISHPQGFTIQVRKSKIDHPQSGYGVFVEGHVLPGTVLALYPGIVYYPFYLTPEVVNNNEYMISRYDDTVIDGRAWEIKALAGQKDRIAREIAGSDIDNVYWKKFNNPYAIGNYINHPPPNKQPNVMTFGYDFLKEHFHRALPDNLKPYIPNEIFKESKLLKPYNVHMRSVVVIATQPIFNSELYMNYRYNPNNPAPDWYWDPDPEESARRWKGRSLWEK